MTPENIESLVHLANIGFRQFDAWSDFNKEQDVVAARSDIAAMRTPITETGLILDGWTNIGAPIPGNVFEHKNFPGGVHIKDGGVHVYSDDNDLNGVNTMYDLRELVRLYGDRNG